LLVRRMVEDCPTAFFFVALVALVAWLMIPADSWNLNWKEGRSAACWLTDEPCPRVLTSARQVKKRQAHPGRETSVPHGTGPRPLAADQTH
jgi:signal transduction histidine kinase